MTPQEQEMIGGLIDRVAKTQLPDKDPEAEAMLQQGLGRNPDSLYILAQTVLVQKYALDQAQKQLADLKAQLSSAQSQQQQPKHATSFLGSIFGSHDEEKPAAPPPAYNQQPSTPPYTPVQSYPQAGYPPQSYPQTGGYAQGPGFGAPASSGGGFLRSAMQTATGVAAGALAFQGIESLMHGFGGGGSSFGGGGGPREEVINNYYGDSARDNRDDRSGLSNDIEDRRDGGSFFDPSRDASSNTADTDAFAGTGTDDDDNSGLGDDSSGLGGDAEDGSFSDVDDSGYTDDSGGSGGGDDSSFS